MADSTTSILLSTKKILGLEADYTAFDVDIIIHINSVFLTLTQLGLGPAEGFAIEDESAVWSDFLGDNLKLNAVKTYIYLRVRLIFDPPATGYVIDAMQNQVRELEFRLSVERESTDWVDPNPTPILPWAN